MSEKDFYGRIAPIYDLLLTPLIRKIRNSVTDWILTEIPGILVDLCCGTGHQLSLLPETTSAYGLDLSMSMVKRASIQTSGRSVCGDATKTPFPDNSISCILSQFALHEKPMDIILEELIEVERLLTEGGKLAVVDFAIPVQNGLLPGIMKKAIHWIESNTDEEHYTSYLKWMEEGGLLRIMETQGWERIHLQDFYRGNIVFAVYTRP